jgi:hypothetical protein
VKILKALRRAGQYIGVCLLLSVSLAYESRGVPRELQLRGLNIEHLLVPNASNPGAAVPADEEYLDGMLRSVTFPDAIIEEKVLTILTEHPTECSDTDESVEEARKDSQGIRFPVSKFTSEYVGYSSKIWLRSSEIRHEDQTLAQITENLCRKLAKDAFCIANAHPNARTRESTTCLCVVLRDEEKRAKKLVFHNSNNKMQPRMRAKAEELMYGIRNAHIAHAEAQFIDFLLYRAKQRAAEIKREGQTKHPRYTHILGMGCSKKHCQECDTLCKLFLGEGYVACTSASSQLSGSEQDEQMPLIETTTQEVGVDLAMTTVQKYQVAFQGAAVRSGNQRSPNYRVSSAFQASICEKSALPLNFSAARFNIRDHVVNPEEQAAAQEDMHIEGEYLADDGTVGASPEEEAEPAASTSGQKRKAPFSS